MGFHGRKSFTRYLQQTRTGRMSFQLQFTTNRPSWGLLAAWSKTPLPGGPPSLLRDLARLLAVSGQDHFRKNIRVARLPEFSSRVNRTRDKQEIRVVSEMGPQQIL